MLSKLLKHEIRSTSRIILPMLAAELLLSVMAGVFIRIMGNNADLHWMLQVLMRLVQILFYVGLFAICVVTFVLMIQRFFKNLMGDEGYIQMTLPVTADGHLWAKLLTSTGWVIIVGIFCYIAVFICGIMGGQNMDITGFGEVYRGLRVEFSSLQSVALMAELIVFGIVCIFTAWLHFYMAMAIGCSASNRKKLYSVLAYFGIGIARNAVAAVVTIFGIATLGRGYYSGALDDILKNIETINGDAAMHIIMIGMILAAAVLGLVYYIVTRVFMTKKLNLA